jgi:hypothetical protein
VFFGARCLVFGLWSLVFGVEGQVFLVKGLGSSPAELGSMKGLRVLAIERYQCLSLPAVSPSKATCVCVERSAFADQNLKLGVEGSRFRI